MLKLWFLATVEADDVGEELVLCGHEISVGAVELAEDVAGIEEEDGVLARAAGLALVEEPEVVAIVGARKAEGVARVSA
ncbi:MAG: hypothetical protein ACJAQT_001590 [Akkermansiaceae bacterium]